jgi:GNAT superfamily N-acetyltransferase
MTCHPGRSSMEIHQATPEESGTLTRIAHLAKRHWGYPENWIERWRDVLTITPEFIQSNLVYIVGKRSQRLGFHALVTRGEELHLEHLWVLPEHIGLGLGQRLFQHAVDLATSRRALRIHIESDPNAEGFYRRMGARKVGEAVSEIDGQIRMLPLLVFEIRGGSESAPI